MVAPSIGKEKRFQHPSEKAESSKRRRRRTDKAVLSGGFAQILPWLKESQTPRVAGLDLGAIWMSDDFDAPLPEEFWLDEQ